jgi:hypothetical protein
MVLNLVISLMVNPLSSRVVWSVHLYVVSWKLRLMISSRNDLQSGRKPKKEKKKPEKLVSWPRCVLEW